MPDEFYKSDKIHGIGQTKTAPRFTARVPVEPEGVDENGGGSGLENGRTAIWPWRGSGVALAWRTGVALAWYCPQRH
jgi:hypothetical protein